MSVDELSSAAERRSLVGRLVSGGRTRSRARVNSAALFMGGLGLGAFGVSLAAEWVIITLDLSSSVGDSEGIDVITMHASAGTVDSLGLVYVLGGVALLGIVGAAISRPDFAARIRLPLLGGAGGLLAVLVALTIQLPSGQAASQLGVGSYLPLQFRERITTEVRPGLYFAYAAILLPVVAVFLAAKPLTRTQAEGPTDASDDEEDVRAPDWVPVRAEGATGLTVSAVDPHDHHAGTDVWRSS